LKWTTTSELFEDFDLANSKSGLAEDFSDQASHLPKIRLEKKIPETGEWLADCRTILLDRHSRVDIGQSQYLSKRVEAELIRPAFSVTDTHTMFDGRCDA
jgi:hypothetical protein